MKFRKYVCGGIRSMKKITFFTFLHVYFLPWRDIIPQLIMWGVQSFVLCSTTTNLITSLGTQCCCQFLHREIFAWTNSCMDLFSWIEFFIFCVDLFFAILYFLTISWSDFSIQLLHFNRFWRQKSEKQTWSSKRRPKTDQNSQNVCLTYQGLL